MISIDGEDIIGLTIDAENAYEITIDGEVAWVATVDPVSYGFEDMSPWTIYNGGQNNNRVKEGSYSYYSGNNGSNKQAEATPFPSGEKITQFKYFYQETSNSHGHGVQLFNSNGDLEGGTATDNPQWDVDFANTGPGQVSGGGNYDEWVGVTWGFDWPNNQVTVSRGGSDPHTGTYDLKHGLDISKIELVNYNGGTWNDSSNLDSWWDEIEFLTDAVIVEGFESGSLSSDWSVNNFYTNRSPSYAGGSAGGSRGNGGIEATWSPLDNPTEIDSFEYKWWETSNQTGHVVILEDENGNEIMESGNENPQWYLNNGSGGRWQVYGGDNYQEWIHFKFTFDWANGEYDYRLEDTASGTVKTGTEQMDNNSPVDRIRFTGDGYGSADDVVFDDIKII